MRVLSPAQVAAALETCGDDLVSLSTATSDMARKAYCKAARLPVLQCPPLVPLPSHVFLAMQAVQPFGHQSIIRMAHFLIEESAKAGATNAHA